MKRPGQNRHVSYPKGSEYDAKWEAMERSGVAIHGEADLVEALGPESVLDAGCGTGRVAIELARRGMFTVGVDVDPEMLTGAQNKAPDLDWVLADLASEALAGSLLGVGEATFDLVVAAGNVMIFVDPQLVPTAIANLAGVIRAGGHLVAGFQLQSGRLSLSSYDEWCIEADLSLRDRWSTWSREPFEPPGDYAVSVHQKAM
ncbi:MAG: class I SAM-dependent methyltransferase [Acidimicrobiales bacterium]